MLHSAMNNKHTCQQMSNKRLMIYYRSFSAADDRGPEYNREQLARRILDKDVQVPCQSLLARSLRSSAESGRPAERTGLPDHHRPARRRRGGVGDRLQHHRDLHPHLRRAADISQGGRDGPHPLPRVPRLLGQLGRREGGAGAPAGGVWLRVGDGGRPGTRTGSANRPRRVRRSAAAAGVGVCTDCR